MARATAYARELADTERAEVVCHGDPHAGNVLRRADGWTLIDPDGFVGERAYDLGVVLRDACREIAAVQESQPRSGEALLREECRRLAGLCGVTHGVGDIDVLTVSASRWPVAARLVTLSPSFGVAFFAL
jgi:streptomycin 6-kinase